MIYDITLTGPTIRLFLKSERCSCCCCWIFELPSDLVCCASTGLSAVQISGETDRRFPRYAIFTDVIFFFQHTPVVRSDDVLILTNFYFVFFLIYVVVLNFLIRLYVHPCRMVRAYFYLITTIEHFVCPMYYYRALFLPYATKLIFLFTFVFQVHYHLSEFIELMSLQWF